MGTRMPTPPYPRMMKRVHVAESGCWLYTGSKDGGGYGTVSIRRGSAPGKAHRISYEHHVGAIPAGTMVCHRCDTPACVNPDHLFIGTQSDNMQDCASKGRISPRSILNLQPGAPGHHGAAPRKQA